MDKSVINNRFLEQHYTLSDGKRNNNSWATAAQTVFGSLLLYYTRVKLFFLSSFFFSIPLLILALISRSNPPSSDSNPGSPGGRSPPRPSPRLLDATIRNQLLKAAVGGSVDWRSSVRVDEGGTGLINHPPDEKGKARHGADRNNSREMEKGDKSVL